MECRQMLYTAFQLNSPAAVRYPRGAGPGVPVEKTCKRCRSAKAKFAANGKRIALLSKKIAILAFAQYGARLQ
jgi:1-deoxy-D-xylulose-5-phosphate synthase